MEWYEKPLRFGGFIMEPEIAKRMNCNVVQISKTEDRLFEKVIEEFHKREIKVICYIGTFWMDEKMAKEHPDWLQKKGVKVKTFEESGRFPCPNSGWRDYTFDYLKDTLKNYEVDGIFFDGPGFYAGSCYCDNCQRRFKKQYGKTIPLKFEDNPDLYRNFIRFRYESINDFIRDAKKEAVSIGSKVPIYMNAQGMKGLTKSCGRDVQEMAEYEDIVGAEAFMHYFSKHQTLDRPLWEQSGTAKFMKAAARRYNKPAVVFVTCTISPWSWRPHPEGEIWMMVGETVANNAGIWFEWTDERMKQPYPEWEIARKAYGFLKENEKFYEGAKSSANVALLWSRQAGDYYDEDEVMDLTGDFSPKGLAIESRDISKTYRSCYRGIYEALIRAHIPFDLVLDKDLEEGTLLSRYKTLILGNAPCLSDIQMEKIKEFVKNGGGLVATYETSLYDKEGRRREDFGLRELLGARIKAGKTEEGFAFGGNILLDKKGHSVKKTLSTIVPAPFYLMSVEPLKESEVIGFFSPRGELKINTNYPILITNRYGRGKVFYIAGNLGDTYWNIAVPEIKQLIANAIEWVSGESPIVSVDTLETIEVVLNYQKKENRYLLHLVNYTGEMARPVNHLLPVKEIKVSLHKRTFPKIKEVTTLKKRQRLSFKEKNDTFEFTIPELANYEVIVIQCQ